MHKHDEMLLRHASTAWYGYLSICIDRTENHDRVSVLERREEINIQPHSQQKVCLTLSQCGVGSGGNGYERYHGLLFNICSVDKCLLNS
jgi:hypothetical protein